MRVCSIRNPATDCRWMAIFRKSCEWWDMLVHRRIPPSEYMHTYIQAYLSYVFFCIAQCMEALLLPFPFPRFLFLLSFLLIEFSVNSHFLDSEIVPSNVSVKIFADLASATTRRVQRIRRMRWMSIWCVQLMRVALTICVRSIASRCCCPSKMKRLKRR